MSSARPGKIFVFSAPSGAGKTTLLHHLMHTVPNLVYSISATTRGPRAGELDGRDYFFMSVNEFKARISQDAFAEWEEVHGNYYGTPRDFVDKTVLSGKHIVMDIDVQGKQKFDRAYPEAIGILIVPPSLDALKERLVSRATDSSATIALRLGNAEKELAFARTQGKYEYTIVNDSFERAGMETVDLIRALIGSAA